MRGGWALTWYRSKRWWGSFSLNSFLHTFPIHSALLNYTPNLTHALYMIIITQCLPKTLHLFSLQTILFYIFKPATIIYFWGWNNMIQIWFWIYTHIPAHNNFWFPSGPYLLRCDSFHSSGRMSILQINYCMHCFCPVFSWNLELSFPETYSSPFWPSLCVFHHQLLATGFPLSCQTQKTPQTPLHYFIGEHFYFLHIIFKLYLKFF